jgi:hypothetical protein
MSSMIERLPNPRELSSLARMTIEHNSGMYLINELPVEQTQLNTVILLGAVRQRVMFTPREINTPSGLECKSYDFEHGKPTPLFAREGSNFPEFAIDEAIAAEAPTLDCGACIFKNWKTDDRGRKVHSRCIPQIVVPLLLPQEDPSAPFIPAVVSYQRSAEQPVTEYMKEFTKANRPAYTAISQLRLNVNLGSGFKYSTPKFTLMGDIGSEFYPVLSLIYRAAKGVIQTPPPPAPARTGGMLSVGTAEVSAPTYSGGFFR